MDRRFAILAIVLAVVFVLIGNSVALLLDFPVNWITSVLTALVVGGFLALTLLRKPPGEEADGFTVSKEE